MTLNLSAVTIETEHLLLVPITQEYAAVIFSEFTPEITTYMHPRAPEKIEETEAFITEAMQKLRDGKDLQIVILNKDTKEFLGCGGLHGVDTPTPELGIWIKKSAHGHGYGREAMQGLKQWADKNLEYDHIVYPVVKENVASRKIPESMGGVVQKEYQKTNMSGSMHDMVEYWIPKKR